MTTAEAEQYLDRLRREGYVIGSGRYEPSAPGVLSVGGDRVVLVTVPGEDGSIEVSLAVRP